MARATGRDLGLWISADRLPFGVPLRLTRDVMSVYGNPWPAWLPDSVDGTARELDLVLGADWGIRLLRADVSDAQVDDWADRPALRGVDARIDLNAAGGTVQLGGDEVELDWPGMFRDALRFAVPACTVELSLGGAAQTMVRDCRVENADLALAGDMVIVANGGRPAVDLNAVVSRGRVDRHLRNRQQQFFLHQFDQRQAAVGDQDRLVGLRHLVLRFDRLDHRDPAAALDRQHEHRQAALAQQGQFALHLHVDRQQALAVEPERHAKRHFTRLRATPGVGRRQQRGQPGHSCQRHRALETAAALGGLPRVYNVWKFTGHRYTMRYGARRPDINTLTRYFTTKTMQQSHSLKIILASTSPYRKDMLSRFPLAFETMAPDVEETPLPGEAPSTLARRLALAKAEAVSGAHPEALVIGSDQVAECDGAAVGKPGDVDTAHAQLQQFSGRTVLYHSAFALVCGESGFRFEENVITEVRFRELSRAAIERYVALDRPLDCAGSIRTEAAGPTLFEYMRSDDPSAIMGLPLIALARGLRRAGFELP